MIAAFSFPDVYPFLTLAVGILIVVGGIVWLRLNAFLALLAAAMVVSLMSPGDWSDKITRVVNAFGSTATGIGIVITLAAIIGVAMTQSGAADRIVQTFLSLMGEKRGAAVLMSSGFVLAIPVFFDTVFYLLVPLARGMYRRTGGHYLRYLLAIACCASAHALVPPTPGPLIVADAFHVDVGTMILVGLLVGLPASLAGLVFAAWADRRSPDLEPPVEDGVKGDDINGGDHDLKPVELPRLSVALAPIVIPIVLITANSLVGTWFRSSDPSPLVAGLLDVLSAIGNPNFALLVSAGIALATMWIYRRPTPERFSHHVEQALMSGGVIVLITCAGGAFGGALKESGIRQAIEALFGDAAASGVALLLLSFAIASLLKFAQGSSTAAMVVASGMVAAMIGISETNIAELKLGYHPVYLATAIGAGSLFGSWMNDSGFWIFAKMGGISEVQALKTWTPLLAIIGAVAMAMTLILSQVMPMAV